MSYALELQAKLDAVREDIVIDKNNATVESIQQRIINGLIDEFNLSQYDLEENDILRAIKISSIIEPYKKVFSHAESLKIFYAIAKADIIKPNLLKQITEIETKELRLLLQKMLHSKLVLLNDDGELELSYEGRSVAERMGVDIFL
jgi:molecular chaperone DnaK (HSP70)